MSRNSAPIVIKTPRHACNTIAGCWPTTPTAPDASSLALITPPYIAGDSLTEKYDSGDIDWVYDEGTLTWGPPCFSPHSGEQHCVANVGEKLSFDPLPSDPTTITGVTVPAGIRPGDTLMVPGLNGFFIFELGADCTTWELCTAFCQEDPAIQIGTVDCCAVPPTVEVGRIQGKTVLHNLLVTLKDASGNILAYADESPQTAAPDFATGTTFTFTGQTFEDGYFVCAEIWSGAQDGSNNLDTTAAGSVVVASDIRRVERFYFAINNGDDTFAPLACDATGPSIPDGSVLTMEDAVQDGNVVLMGGTEFRMQADFATYLATTIKASATYCEATCTYCLTVPEFADKCPEILPLIELRPCVLLSGDVDDCGNIDINKLTAEPDAPTTGDYEHSVQVSIDGGGTWLNPDSIFGGEVWIPWGGTPYCPAFAEYPLANGSLARNCLRRVGTTNVIYEVKQVPDPQITVNAANVFFANAAVEPHPCLDHADDAYVLTVKAFDAANALIESWTSTAWAPAAGNIDLTGAPTDIAAALSTGVDGFTLNTNLAAMTIATELEYELAITHNYICP